MTDPYGHVTHFEYNNGNQLTAVTDPLGRTNRAVFDAWGNMVKTINALGAVTNYEYDGLSQLIAVTDPLGAEVSLTTTWLAKSARLRMLLVLLRTAL